MSGAIGVKIGFHFLDYRCEIGSIGWTRSVLDSFQYEELSVNL